MNMRRALLLLATAAALPLGGCSALGSAVGGISQLIGTLLQLGMMLAGPALAYYLYKRNNDE